jgi:N-acetylglucosamine kinase-like BadF-type ATPase
MDKYVIGLEGAAKVSRVAVTKSDGEFQFEFSLPPLNPNYIDNFIFAIREVFISIAEKLHLSLPDLFEQTDSSCLSISGIKANDEKYFAELLSNIGINLSGNLIICEDIYSHIAANLITDGGIVISSTGSNCSLVFGSDMETKSIGGWGSEISDEGSAYCIGINAIKLVLNEIDYGDKVDPVFAAALLKQAGLSDKQSLYKWFHELKKSLNWRHTISDLSIPITTLAESDNQTAVSILKDSLLPMINNFRILIELNKQKILEFRKFPILLEGGVFDHCHLYRRLFKEEIRQLTQTGIPLKVEKPKYYPVVGAVIIALTKSRFFLHENESVTKFLTQINKTQLCPKY